MLTVERLIAELGLELARGEEAAAALTITEDAAPAPAPAERSAA